MLNLAQLAFNIATTLYVVVALLVSGLLLYKSRLADLLILILCFLSALNLIDVVLLKAISLFSSDAIVAQLMTGFSLERVGMLVLSKGLDVLVLWLFAKFIRRLQGRQRQPGPGPVLAFAACGYLAALYLQYTILGQALALSQQQMRVSLVLVTLLFLAYLVLRLHLLKEAQRSAAPRWKRTSWRRITNSRRRPMPPMPSSTTICMVISHCSRIISRVVRSSRPSAILRD